MADEMKKVAEAEAMTGETPETRETECTKDEAPLIRIVDDDGDLRDALLYMLSQEGWEAAAFPDAESFLRSAAPSAPGVLILDVRMPGMSGIELHRELRRRGFEQPVIFLTAHGDIDMAVDTMQKGAAAFVQKTADRSRLMAAISRAVARSTGPAADPGEEVARWRALTAREREVAELIAEGLLNREVGERLGGISVKTVQVHRGEVCRKLGVKGASGISQAVRRVKRILESDPEAAAADARSRSYDE